MSCNKIYQLYSGILKIFDIAGKLQIRPNNINEANFFIKESVQFVYLL